MMTREELEDLSFLVLMYGTTEDYIEIRALVTSYMLLQAEFNQGRSSNGKWQTH